MTRSLSTASKFSSVVDVISAAVFVAFLSLPAGLTLMEGSQGEETFENRLLAPFPSFDGDSDEYGSLKPQFEAWYTDHFGLRNQLIRWNNIVRVLWLGASPDVAGTKGKHDETEIGVAPDPLARRFTKGRGSWFYTFDDDMMADYRGLRPYSRQELNRWQATYEARERWLAERGITYLLVLVPDKHLVYPEHLPWNVKRAYERTRSTQVAAHLKANSKLRVVDLLPTLLEAKSDERLYNRTGTHWNEYGAHVAYREIFSVLKIPSRPLEDYTVERQVGPGRPFVNLISIQDLVSEEHIKVLPKTPRLAQVSDGPPNGDHWLLGFPGSQIVKEIENPELPRAVVFHDSFVAVNLEPFLSEHFERVYYSRSYNFDRDLVESEKPDIVIEERTSRAFLRTTP